MTAIRADEPCPCGSGKRYRDCHEKVKQVTQPPRISRRISLEVIAEPDPGTASIFEYRGEGSTIFRGFDSEISFDCGHCGASLIVGMMPNQVSGIVLKCKGCGRFNYVGDIPAAENEVAKMANGKAQPDPKNWLNAKSLSHRSFRITDIPLTGEPILSGLMVEDSTVYGPAVIAPLDGNTFDSIMFRADPEAMLWEVPSGKRIIGAIGVRDCVFRRCTFDGIGIAGPPELLARFREMVKSPGP